MWGSDSSTARVCGLTLLVCLSTLAVPATAPANRLLQLPGPGGCIVGTAVGGCTQQSPIGSPADVVVRGNHAYVSSTSDDRIRIYDRNPTTGDLTPRPAGIAGCIAEDGPGTGCSDGRALDAPGQMVMSADGLTLYVASGGAYQGVAVLTRDPATGNLSQQNAMQACVSQTGNGAQCGTAAPIASPVGIALSPDGADVYVSGQGPSGGFVTLLDVISGGLAQHPAASGGCAENNVTSVGCLDARAMNGGRDVGVTPDGKHVYVTSTISNAVTVFTRNVATGELALVNGQDGCLQMTSTSEGCRTTDRLGTEVYALAIASDSRLYVGGVTSGSVTLLSRDASTGGLTVPGPCASSAAPGDPTGACTDITHNMFGTVDFALTPDRSALIVAARYGRGLTGFALGSDGAPVPWAPPLGCIATGGSGFTTNCALPRGFARVFGQDFGPNGVALSDDARFAYAASPSDAEDGPGIVAARRDTADPVCQDATVDVTGGNQVALPLACSDADGDPVTLSVVGTPARGVTGQVDQGAGTVQYAAPTDFDGTETLTFKGTANGFDSAPATVSIRITRPAGPTGPSDRDGDGIPDSLDKCPDQNRGPVDPDNNGCPGPFPRLRPIISMKAKIVGSRFRIVAISVRVPKGTKVAVKCAKGCKKSQVRTAATVTFKRFKGLAVKKGAVIEIRSTRKNFIGAYTKYTFTKTGFKRIDRCLPVGSTKPQRSCR